MDSDTFKAIKSLAETDKNLIETDKRIIEWVKGVGWKANFAFWATAIDTGLIITLIIVIANR